MANTPQLITIRSQLLLGISYTTVHTSSNLSIECTRSSLSLGLYLMAVSYIVHIHLYV